MDNTEQIQQLNNRMDELETLWNKNTFSNRDVSPRFADFQGQLKIPVFSATPSVCEIGQECAVGGVLYLCSAVNTWTAQAVSPITQLANTFTAGPQCTAGQVVAIGPYQSDGGITLDTKGVNNNTKSFNITVGANNNRILVVFAVDSESHVMTMTYNGVSLTEVQVAGRAHIFYLFAPATGTNSLAITSTSATASLGYCYYSYYNVYQSALDFSAIAQQDTALSSNTVADGVVVLGCGMTSSGITSTTGTAYVYDTQTSASNTIVSGSAGIVYPAVTSINFTVASGGTNYQALLGMAPVTTVSEYVIQPASASNVSNQFFKLYNNVVGIVPTTIAATASGSVIINGVATGLSGLSASNKVYYLSDSAGSISTTAGTNSKKIGINLSTTTLLLQLS